MLEVEKETFASSRSSTSRGTSRRARAGSSAGATCARARSCWRATSRSRASLWETDALALTVRAFAAGPPAGSSLFATYRVENRGAAPLRGSLFLAVRPIQVISAWQFLNLSPGFAPIYELGFADGALRVNVEKEVRVLSPSDGFGAGTLRDGELADALRAGKLPPRSSARDPEGFVSGALRFAFELAPGAARDVEVEVPFYRERAPPRGRPGRRGARRGGPRGGARAPGAPSSGACASICRRPPTPSSASRGAASPGSSCTATERSCSPARAATSAPGSATARSPPPRCSPSATTRRCASSCAGTRPTSSPTGRSPAASTSGAPTRRRSTTAPGSSSTPWPSTSA